MGNATKAAAIILRPKMSASGQNRKSRPHCGMSAFPQRADIACPAGHVRFVPIPEVAFVREMPTRRMPYGVSPRMWMSNSRVIVNRNSVLISDMEVLPRRALAKSASRLTRLSRKAHRAARSATSSRRDNNLTDCREGRSQARCFGFEARDRKLSRARCRRRTQRGASDRNRADRLRQWRNYFSRRPDDPGANTCASI
jgi:hypothetical protein